MKRQPIVWIAVALFVGGTVAGALSLPGSANDSLISQSYALGTYLESVTGQASAKAQSILDTTVTAKLTELESQYDTQTITSRIQTEVLAALGQNGSRSFAANTVITAQTGTELTLQSGSAAVSQGTWINLTTGKAVTAGSDLKINQVYLAADDNVSVKLSSSSSIAISGQYTTGTASSAGTSSSGSTVTVQYTAYADALQSLGLFQGTSKGYELERPATRLEGIVMLIRLLGKEQAALSYTSSHPFTDVPAWATRYVAYAYQQGYTSGIDATTFGSTMNLRYLDYMTFLLRALGYSDSGGDFSWSTADQSAVDLGIQTAGERQAIVQSGQFLRDHVAYTSYRALFVKTKRSSRLCDDLITAGVFSQSQLDAVQKKGL